MFVWLTVEFCSIRFRRRDFLKVKRDRVVFLSKPLFVEQGDQSIKLNQPHRKVEPTLERFQ
jgi:hypothetical protein